MIAIDCAWPGISQQLLAAPPACRLIDLHVMAAREQLGDDTAQEMGVPVIPI